MREDKAYDQAIAAHQEGHLEQAIQKYRAIVRKNPKHAAALHHLGLALYQKGDTRRANR
jgi:Flp pilus assembly protein TadD